MGKVKMYDLVVKNGLLVLENEIVRNNLGICNGKIAAIFEDGCTSSAAKHEIDAAGCYVMPGAIDTHTHFFEPGGEWREDFEHGTRAAASGGFTCIMEMPNSNPAVTDRETFLLKKRLADRNSVVDYAIWAGATAVNLDKLEELKALGSVAFKAFTLDAGPTFPYLNTEMEMEAMKKIKELDCIFGFHAEDPIVVSERRKRCEKEEWSVEQNDRARPYYAELSAINQIILFAKETGCKVHICHLSIPEGAELIAQAKKNGVDITVESCSHYFLLNLENAEKFDTYALIQPPIRSRARMEKMWDYLFDGSIDYLATDHAPYPEEDKEPADGNKWNVIGGTPSIDVAFELMFDEAVLKRKMSPVQYAKLSATNAAKRFGLYPKKGSIRIGADADLAILNPDHSWIIDRNKSFSKTRNTKFPYQGRKVDCKVETTIVRGNVVFKDDKIVAQDGYGKLVCPVRE
ncbi:MAG: allantoinase AllB [Eubacteriales bacterium]|nr:allantoinase AllB [Eubacteriales bacterium]